MKYCAAPEVFLLILGYNSPHDSAEGSESKPLQGVQGFGLWTTVEDKSAVHRTTTDYKHTFRRRILSRQAPETPNTLKTSSLNHPKPYTLYTLRSLNHPKPYTLYSILYTLQTKQRPSPAPKLPQIPGGRQDEGSPGGIGKGKGNPCFFTP